MRNNNNNDIISFIYIHILTGRINTNTDNIILCIECRRRHYASLRRLHNIYIYNIIQCTRKYMRVLYSERVS